MVKVLAGLGLALLTSCGGATSTTAPEQAGSGGGAGASSGGSDAAGTSSGGSNAGTGGKVPDALGGSAGASPLACSTPYAGPSGGPRSDGPSDLGPCVKVSDEAVLARYKDRSARVPQGLYYEPRESITFWTEPCSKSAKETETRGATDGAGTFVASYESEWFYEAVYCKDENVRRIERNLRCDYFDGTQLANPTPERLAFLASMLWWSKGYNVEGDLILGHSVAVGDATDVVELCTLSTTFGDFGLCDEVRLESTKHRLRADGTVELGTPQVLRTLEGDCH